MKYGSNGRGQPYVEEFFRIKQSGGTPSQELIDDIYHSYETLIVFHASKFWRSYGANVHVEYEDIIQEYNLLFLSLLNSYDASKGKFSSYFAPLANARVREIFRASRLGFYSTSTKKSISEQMVINKLRTSVDPTDVLINVGDVDPEMKHKINEEYIEWIRDILLTEFEQPYVDMFMSMYVVSSNNLNAALKYSGNVCSYPKAKKVMEKMKNFLKDADIS